MTEQEFYKEIGTKLKALRERSGKKQKDIAEALGVKPPFISDIENKGVKVSAFQLKRILSTLGFSHSDLFEDEEKKTLNVTLQSVPSLYPQLNG